MNLDLGRAVADAVLYEGYLLYPYRSTSSKNQSRWQFGVVGPPGAEEAGLGEASSMTMQTVLETGGRAGKLVVHVRFLQLQHRQIHDTAGTAVPEVVVGGATWTTWDEAVEREVELTIPVESPEGGTTVPIQVPGNAEFEPLVGFDGTDGGAVVRRTWPLSAELRLQVMPHGDHSVLDLVLQNVHPVETTDRESASRFSLIGLHVLIEAHGVAFVSMVDPPASAASLVAGCRQDRCWPVLTGAPGDTDLLLGSPIILYDYPEIAAESAGALFDATEIDEILTLRVMTMTEHEKAEARATDPRAREIIDRCDAMTPEDLQRLHGVFRDPHAGPEDVPWWSPETDESVSPGTDAVTIDGVQVARDSLVRVHPNRRADAQDLFYADQVARVTAVLSDVDGGTHVALVLVDDPAADLNDLAGRYWYFDPDEVTPLSAEETQQVQQNAQHKEV
jgi:hypothetical protein